MFIKVCRVGKDPDLKFTAAGDPVVSLDLAYDIGYGENAKTQWIRASFFGSRAEKVHPYLKKGGKILLTGDDVCVEMWERNGKSGATLKCRVQNIELLGGKNDNQQQDKSTGAAGGAVGNQQRQPTPPAQRQAAQNQGGFDDFGSDIPF